VTDVETTTGTPRSKQPAHLVVEQLEVVYNHVQLAVQGVSIQVAKDEIVAVLGTNGAGKTTTLRAISGFLPGDNAEITDGRILLGGETITGKQPHVLARQGLVIVPERDKIFTTLTVQENLGVVSAGGRKLGATELDRIAQLFPVLLERRKQLAGYLSGGERQMLAIAKALLLSPSVLLVDELSFGLAPKVVETLMQTLLEVHRLEKTAVLLVEQNALAALAIADYAYVLENGRVVFDGTPARVHEHEDIREFYLGGTEGFTDLKQYKRRRRWWG
jgi:branched-chain amino acid transport system ATP-binding protein